MILKMIHNGRIIENYFLSEYVQDIVTKDPALLSLWLYLVDNNLDYGEEEFAFLSRLKTHVDKVNNMFK